MSEANFSDTRLELQNTLPQSETGRPAKDLSKTKTMSQ